MEIIKLKTNGICFLCLENVPNKYENEETRETVSFNGLLNYLEIKLENLIEVELCNLCKSLTAKLTDIIHLENQMKINYFLEEIHRRVSNSKTNVELVQRYSKIMTSDAKSLSQLLLVDNLRKNILEKCSSLKKGPRLQVKLTKIPLGKHVVKTEALNEVDTKENSIILHEPSSPTDSQSNSAPVCLPEEEKFSPETTASCLVSSEATNMLGKQNNIKPRLYFKCSFCPLKFENKKGFQEHYNRVHKGGKCSECNARIRTRKGLLRHMAAHRTATLFRCESCKRYFNSQHVLSRHIHRDHKPTGEGALACGICGKSEANLDNLRVHMESIHGKILRQTNQCSICQEAFKDELSFNYHLADVHTPPLERELAIKKALTCSICTKTLGKVGSIRNHMKCHSEDRPFLCEHCPKRFKFKTYLKAHITGIHKKEKATGKAQGDTSGTKMKLRHIACTVCPKKFTSSSGLRQHLTVVHRPFVKTNFQCDICGSLSTSAGNLKKHVFLMHTGRTIKKPPPSTNRKYFECPICQKKICAARRNLQVHVRVHTGEKPFKCEICGESYPSAESLKKHKRRQHTENKPSFPCEICGKRYLHQRSLDFHKYTQHNLSGKVDSSSSAQNAMHLASPLASVLQEVSSPILEHSSMEPDENAEAEEIPDLANAEAKQDQIESFDKQPEPETSSQKPIKEWDIEKWPQLRIKLTRIPAKPEKIVGKADLEEDSKAAEDSFPSSPALSVGSGPHSPLAGFLTDEEDALPLTSVLSDEGEGSEANTKNEEHLKDLNSSETENDKQEKIILQCPCCPLKFEDTKLLLQHKRTHRGRKGSVNKNRDEKRSPTNQMIGKSNEQLYKCDICLKQLKSKHNLYMHRQLHKPPDVRTSAFMPAPCPSCGKIVSQKRDLKRHMEKCVPGNQPRTLKKQRDYLTCRICEKSFKDLQALDDHLKSSDPEAHELEGRTCSICKKIFAERKTKNRHVQRVHDRIKPYLCELCPKTFFENNELNDHLNTVHLKQRGIKKTLPKFQCDICLKQLKSKQSLYMHRQLHKPPDERNPGFKAATCTICGNIVSRKRDLKRHMEKCVSGSQPRTFKQRDYLTCGICEKSFKDLQELDNHLKNSDPEAHKLEGRTCSICKKVFVDRISKKKHVRRVHDRIKPYLCELCPKAFFESSHLKVHLNTVHRKQRGIKKPNFQCDICGNSSTTASNLEKHVFLMHTERNVKKPQPLTKNRKYFECPICKKKICDSRRNLQNHMRVHTGEKPYKCDLCEGEFNRSSILSKHMRTKHSENKPTFPCGSCDKQYSCQRDLDFHKYQKHNISGKADPSI